MSLRNTEDDEPIAVDLGEVFEKHFVDAKFEFAQRGEAKLEHKETWNAALDAAIKTMKHPPDGCRSVDAHVHLEGLKA